MDDLTLSLPVEILEPNSVDELVITQFARTMDSASPQTPTTTPEAPATSFTLFPNLTAEVRVQIWRFYLLNPHLITISAHPSPFPTSVTCSHSPINLTFHILRDAPCSLLSVNSEARHEAIRFYSALPDPEEVEENGLPFHTQHRSSTRGFYRAPGSDVVYLQGCYYDSRWFRGVGLVGREVITSFSELLSRSLNAPSLAKVRQWEVERRGKAPLVGRIKNLAVDSAFLSDETLFGRPEVSPVMVYLMRDLKGLEELIIVKGEGDGDMAAEVIEGRIEAAREKLVQHCELWGYGNEVLELRAWVAPKVRLLSREELGA